MGRTHSTAILGGKPLEPENNREPLEQKKNRVRRELIAAGMTAYGLRKFNTRYLPRLLADNEHVKGVIYGRFSERPGLLSYVDRMVVATDQRVISLNHKPGYTDVDEFTYDTIDGVEESIVLSFSAVTLNTKVAHFTIRFANKRCAAQFVRYVEQRRLDYFTSKAPSPPPPAADDGSATITE